MAVDMGIITKDNLGKLLGDLSKTRDVYAPAPGPGTGREGMEYRSFASGGKLDFAYPSTRLSSKGILFPQREVLLSFKGAEQKGAPPFQDRPP